MVYGGSEAVIPMVIQPQLNLCAPHLHHLMFICAARLEADSADLAQSQRSLSLAVNGLWQRHLSTRVLPTATGEGVFRSPHLSIYLSIYSFIRLFIHHCDAS